MNLSVEQYEQLLRAINPKRVSTFKKAGKEFAYVEAYELRAHMNRIFGFAEWSEDVLAMELVFEDKGEKGWVVCYRAGLRLTVGQATYTEWATGDAQNFPSRADAHDMAVKTAQSQALKRCCANLGDQFGLGLYNKGSKASLVRQSLQRPEVKAAESGVDEHITETLAPETADSAVEEPARETSSRKAPEAPVEDAAFDREMPLAEATVDQVFNGTSPLDHIRKLLTFPDGMDLADQMRAVRDAMALATEHGLNEQRIPTGQSLAAYLTDKLQIVSAAIAAAAMQKNGS